MAGFVFEKNLQHQTAAVDAVLQALKGIILNRAKDQRVNPTIRIDRSRIGYSLKDIYQKGKFSQAQNINVTEANLDISMETGTGKTYCYTKTIFALHKEFGVSKFIIAVPRVAIKAGTVSFLTMPAAREHFRDEFHQTINVYEVKSQSSKAKSKDSFPQAIIDFCRADASVGLHVLIINAGMINSSTMTKAFDQVLFDKFAAPADALAHVRPVLIIDEPHMFKRDGKTFKALSAYNPQLTLRYGATFGGDIVNLVYELNAVQAFNGNLVKGIVAHIEEFEAARKVSVTLAALTNEEASFTLNDQGKESRHALKKGDSMALIHDQMQGLMIDKISKTSLILSNGLELRKGDKINPYSYAESLQDTMMRNAIVTHFELERRLLLSSPRIKPLALFFIDNIESYRTKDGAMRRVFEAMLRGHLESLYQQETDETYKDHLAAALRDISALHGGYFSKDNNDSDEKIEKEVGEILHDKESLLAIENPRRFIFSKWTLREGWDNPNVFTICKLRSSGSEISKLQEVGRGLRLPVNEFMARDKNIAHQLHYFVDFTEGDFAERIAAEINQTAGLNFDRERLDDRLIEILLKQYQEFAHDDNKLLEKLVMAGVINFNRTFKSGGYEHLQQDYPAAFQLGVKPDKVTTSRDRKKTTVSIRQENYAKLKTLWETISRKMILKYHCSDEDFVGWFRDYFAIVATELPKSGSLSKLKTLVASQELINVQEKIITTGVTYFKMMSYQSFLKELAKAVTININSLHKILKDSPIDLNPFLNATTIRKLDDGFRQFLLGKFMANLPITYREVRVNIHPTAFTDSQGSVKSEYSETSLLGQNYAEGTVPPDSYLLDKIFYDSEMELENSRTDIADVEVFTKIPKNSIRIPLIGGASYSPDFAFVIKRKNGTSRLNLVVESKGKREQDLGQDEKLRIAHAERFFGDLGGDVKVHFKAQLSGTTLIKLIQEQVRQAE